MQPLSLNDNFVRQLTEMGFDEDAAADALASSGGDVDAAVALLLARDRQGQIEASVRSSRLDSSGGGVESVTNPSASASTQQFFMRVSDIESGEQCNAAQQLSDVFAVGGSRWRACVYLTSPSGVPTISVKLNCISGWSVPFTSQIVATASILHNSNLSLPLCASASCIVPLQAAPPDVVLHNLSPLGTLTDQSTHYARNDLCIFKITLTVSKADALPLTRLGGGRRGLEGVGAGTRDAAARVVADFDAAAAAAAAAVDGGAAAAAAAAVGASGASMDSSAAAAGSPLVTLMLASPAHVTSSRCLGVCDWASAAALEVDRSATWGEIHPIIFQKLRLPPSHEHRVWLLGSGAAASVECTLLNRRPVSDDLPPHPSPPLRLLVYPSSCPVISDAADSPNVQVLLNIARQAETDNSTNRSTTNASHVPIVVKWYSSSQRELLPLGVVQMTRDTRLSAISRHVLSQLPSRLTQNLTPSSTLVYNEREGGGVVALPLISTLADEGLPAGSVLVFESPPSAFPSYARNVSQHPVCSDSLQFVDVRLKSAAAARASDNPRVLGVKVLRVNKDATVAEVTAAAAAAALPSSSSPVLLFPEISGLMRPSSYALDSLASPASPLFASAIATALPAPLCLFWQPQSLETHVDLNIMFFNSKVEPQRNHNIKVPISSCVGDVLRVMGQMVSSLSYSGELRLLAVDSHRITRVFRNDDKIALMHHACVLRCEEIPPAPPSSPHPLLLLQVVRYLKDPNSGSVSLYGHPFMLQCCRADSPRTLRSLIQPIAGSSVRLRRLDPSLKPLSFDSVSQISTASAFNGDAGVEWLGLERMAEGGQPEGRDASEVMVAAEAAAAAAPMSARVQQQQQQQQAAAALRLSRDVPPLPLSARGLGVAGAAVQQQPLSARARVPVALNRGGGSRNTDVVPDDDAANPQPAASRLQQQQQQHPRLNVVLTGSQADAPRPVPPLDVAGLNARMMAPAASAAGDAGAEGVSWRGNHAPSSARSSHAAAGTASARGEHASAAAVSARAQAVAEAGSAQQDVKRDVVTASNISELRSKVLTCQEEVQRMKEYAVELERDNASLKQQLGAVTAERDHLLGRGLGQLNEGELVALEESVTRALQLVRQARIEALESAKRSAQEQQLCKVCSDNAINVVLVPCGHMCLCNVCADKVTSCPLCRTMISQRVRTFLS